MSSLYFNGVAEYVQAIGEFRLHIVELKQSGIIAESTASRIILDAEYNFYNQLVSVNFTLDQETKQGINQGEEVAIVKE
ncbi:hypothetical protein D3C72_2156320 [compost metagenome]